MSENNKGRFVQISNFRNIGVSEEPQIICINRSVNSDYIGNLVLLIGPNNSGKTNVLKALNILNEGIHLNQLIYLIQFLTQKKQLLLNFLKILNQWMFY